MVIELLEWEQTVHSLWGNSEEIANAMLKGIMLTCPELSHEEQIKYAIKIGILLGETKDNGAKDFIDRFSSEILQK